MSLDFTLFVVLGLVLSAAGTSIVYFGGKALINWVNNKLKDKSL